MQKKVLALHDLSGFGRSSLVPIIAAISAAGHQCVPLPTAYFSTHMAIPGWETVDLTGVMPRVIDQYNRLGLQFESVYAGFLGSADQIDCVRDAVLRLKSENGTAFIDPVMGDNGEVYATYTPEMCTRMRELCEIADIITPNTTEAAILLNGRALADACALAGEFVKDCIAYTAAQHTDPMHGVQFEKLLPRLFSCHENWTEV